MINHIVKFCWCLNVNQITTSLCSSCMTENTKNKPNQLYLQRQNIGQANSNKNREMALKLY